MATAAAAEGASPRTAENMGETRRRWQEIESQAAAAANTPQRRPSASTPGSQKVKGVLDKVSLQYKLGRDGWRRPHDPSLQQLDLTNNAQFLGLTLGQKSRAIEIIATGSALHTLKLHSLVSNLVGGMDGTKSSMHPPPSGESSGHARPG